MELRKYTVTVRRFDPRRPLDDQAVDQFLLPVDSPDEEHAVSAAMSNAVAFTPKVQDGGSMSPVAFWATEVRERET